MITINLSKHLCDLFISDISLSEINTHLLELISIHSAIGISIINLEAMLQFYN